MCRHSGGAGTPCPEEAQVLIRFATLQHRNQCQARLHQVHWPAARAWHTWIDEAYNNTTVSRVISSDLRLANKRGAERDSCQLHLTHACWWPRAASPTACALLTAQYTNVKSPPKSRVQSPGWASNLDGIATSTCLLYLKCGADPPNTTNDIA